MSIKYKLSVMVAVGVLVSPLISFAQSMPVTSTSSPAIVISPASDTPPAGKIVMGSTGNLLEEFNLTAGVGNTEDVKVTKLPVYDFVVPNVPKLDLNNLSLWNGSTELGTASGSMAVGSSTEEYIFYLLGNSIIVPRGNSVSLTLKADVVAYAGGATDDQVNILHILPAGIKAMGQNSNTAATITGSATANPQTVLRSTLAFAATPLGATVGRSKVPADQLATLSFSANSAGSLAVNKVNVTFMGSAVTPSLTQPNAVRLLDENNNPLGISIVATTTASGTVVWSFGLGSNINGEAVSAGATRNWTLVVNDDDLAVATGQNAVNLTATINMPGGITYTDGLSTPATSGLILPSSYIFPIELNSVMFARGI